MQVKNIETFEQESNIELIKTLSKKIIKNWYLFVVSLLVMLIAAFFVYKSSPPKFKNSLVMLISQDGDRWSQRASGFVQFEMFDIQSSIEDELGILQSFPIMNKTIRQ